MCVILALNKHLVRARIIFKSGIDIATVSTEYLIAARRWTRYKARICSDFDRWFSHSIGHNYSSAMNFAERSATAILSENPKAKLICEVKQLQKCLYTRAVPLYSNPNYIDSSIRRKTNQWDCYITPCTLARRVASNFNFAFNCVKPAVAFAYLRLVLGGWCTYQLMHNLPDYKGEDRCVFGCRRACDNIKHYIRCPFVRDAFVSCVPFCQWKDSPAFFFIVDDSSSPAVTANRLKFAYAAYMAYNKLRYIPAGALDSSQLIREFFLTSTWSRSA